MKQGGVIVEKNFNEIFNEDNRVWNKDFISAIIISILFFVLFIDVAYLPTHICIWIPLILPNPCPTHRYNSPETALSARTSNKPYLYGDVPSFIRGTYCERVEGNAGSKRRTVSLLKGYTGAWGMDLVKWGEFICIYV